jgi:hypothetical protein
MMIPPVGDADVGAETFSVPAGARLLLKLDGVVTSNDMTQPLLVELVQPVGVPL